MPACAFPVAPRRFAVAKDDELTMSEVSTGGVIAVHAAQAGDAKHGA